MALAEIKVRSECLLLLLLWSLHHLGKALQGLATERKRHCWGTHHTASDPLKKCLSQTQLSVTVPNFPELLEVKMSISMKMCLQNGNGGLMPQFRWHSDNSLCPCICFVPSSISFAHFSTSTGHRKSRWKTDVLKGRGQNKVWVWKR